MDNKYKETFETWNKVAKVYEDKFMHLDVYNETYDYFCDAIVKPKAKILEIGCGPGNITQYLLSKKADFDILGIDIAPNMIQLAKKNNPKAQFKVMDCREIGNVTSTFDGIIAGFCLPYLSPNEVKNLIKTAFDLLNDKGVIYLSFVEGNPNESDFKVGSAGRVFFQYHDLKILKHHLLKINFTNIKIFKVKYKLTETTFEQHTVLTATK